jgi:hypothetical protein
VSGIAIYCAASNRVGKARQALAKIAALPMERLECGAKRFVFTEKRACAKEHAGEVGRAVDPVDEAIQPTGKRSFVRAADEPGGLGPKLVEDELDAPTSRDYVAKGKARRDQTDDFLVFGARVPMHEADWIPAKSGVRIELGE